MSIYIYIYMYIGSYLIYKGEPSPRVLWADTSLDMRRSLFWGGPGGPIRAWPMNVCLLSLRIPWRPAKCNILLESSLMIPIACALFTRR